jgi:putative oxidoreductase
MELFQKLPWTPNNEREKSVIVKTYTQLLGNLRKIAWLAPLIARITIGIVFVESGWGKLQHLDKVVEFFASIGVPAPAIQAPFVAGTELVAGLLVLFGFLTRIASIPLIIVMCVAIMTAKKADLSGWTDIFGFSEFLYIVLLFWLVMEGAGKISVDNLLAEKKGKH